MLGDTAQLRAAARSLDSAAAVLVAGGVADSMSTLAADSYLALGDSAAALRSLRFFLDRGAVTTNYFIATGSEEGFPLFVVVPHSMLLRAELAAAAGQRDEARTWYRRFIDAWATAIPELQPIVAQARTNLAALGDP